MKTGEESYCKVFQSPRLPRAVLAPDLQYGRRDFSNPEARTNADHRSKQSASYKETCRGNVDNRIPGLPHSTVQNEDSNGKEIVKRLIQQNKNHQHRDSFIEDLNKTEELNPFSEKSKELITRMAIRNTSSLARLLLKYYALIALYIGKRALFSAHAANACRQLKGIDS